MRIHQTNPARSGSHHWLTCLLMMTLVSVAYGATPNPPGKMTFQGFLTDASSPPVPLGNAVPVNQDVTFKIYDAGTAGTVQWAESQIVTVDKGHFSVLLGEGSAVSGLPHSNDLSGVFIGANVSERWLGITVNGAEITPRIQFFAAPYSQLAKAANSLTSEATANNLTAAGSVTVSGPVTAGALTVNGDATASGNLTAAGLTINGDATQTGTFNGGHIVLTDHISGHRFISHGSVAGFEFSERDTANPWVLYSHSGSARLWSGGDLFTVSGTGVVTANGAGVNFLTANNGIGIGATADATVALLRLGSGLSNTKISLWDNGAGGAYGLGVQAGQYRLHVNSPGDRFSFLNGPAGTEVMTVQGGGNVGIGVVTPRAPLHVKKENPALGSGTRVPGRDLAYGVYLGADGSVLTPANIFVAEGDNQTIAFGTLSAIFDGDIIASSHIWTGLALEFSDARAKTVEGASDSVEDLAILEQLTVRDFHWTDRTVDDFHPHRKLLAQEVEGVFPQAVHTAPEPVVIPSIYEMASGVIFDDSTKQLQLAVTKKHELEVGDFVDLVTESARIEKAVVTAVADPFRFSVKSEKPLTNVFVYGKYVDDFRSVDYDAIAMLNVSATQELARRTAELEKRMQELEQRENRIAAIEKRLAKFESLERKLASLERRATDRSKKSDDFGFVSAVFELSE